MSIDTNSPHEARLLSILTEGRRYMLIWQGENIHDRKTLKIYREEALVFKGLIPASPILFAFTDERRANQPKVYHARDILEIYRYKNDRP